MKKIYLMGLSAMFAFAVNAQTTVRIKNPLTRNNKEIIRSNTNQGSPSSRVAQVNGNLVCNTFYTAGTTMDLEFTFFQTGDNTEWIDMFTLTFPAGITPNSSPDATFPTLSAAGGAETLNPVSGQDISWGADIDDGYGGIVDDGTGLTFTVNVTIAPGTSSTQVATFLASGDTYTTTGNPTPGNASGSCNIYEVGTPIVDITANVVGVFTSPTTVANAQNCSLGTHTVACQIKNIGDNSETNIPVNYSVNGVPSTPAVYPGPLAAGDSALVAFPVTYDFSAQDVYTITATASLSGDMFPSNDAITTQMTNSLPFALTSSTYTNGIETNYDYASMNLDWTGIGLPFGLSSTKHSGTQALFYTVNMTTIGAPAGTYEAFINLPCMDVVNGETYRISFYKKALTATGFTVNGQTGVFTGLGQDAASMTTVLKPYSALTPTTNVVASWVKDSVDYVATATETRYFAIAGKGTLATATPPQQINVRIDDIKIEKVTGSVGIKTNALTEMALFPNPTTGMLNINAVEVNTTVEVYSVIGEKVYSGNLAKGNNNVDLSGLANGSYIVKLNSGNQNLTKKVVISK
jgi:hypothetical protein